ALTEFVNDRDPEVFERKHILVVDDDPEQLTAIKEQLREFYEVTVINGGKNRFSVKNLWNYQVKFFKKLGALYIAIDIVKRYVLFLDPETVNWVFGCGAVTSEDMKLLSTDENNEAGISPLEIVRKVMILLSKPKLILGLLGAVTKAARGFALGMLIPKKYNEREIKEWQKEYEKCIKHVK
ncbi:MAG: hypothetical protein IK036_02600, partial [Clostridia bacterium]|nr:hypothetical protein [Clostridia bacterium]